MPSLKIDVAPGELLDKITILEIKIERIQDPAKLQNVRFEYGILQDFYQVNLPENAELQTLRAELKAVNEIIWQVEDDIRDHERRQDFGPSFVELARAVYHNNDRRAALKRAVNLLLDSALIEEKSYKPY